MHNAVKTQNKPLALDVGDLVTFYDFSDPECEIEPENKGHHIWELLERYRHINAAGGSCYYFYARNFHSDERELWIEWSSDVAMTLRPVGGAK
jgi:hypothetical protein